MGMNHKGRPFGTFILKADEATLKTLRGAGQIRCTTKEAAALLHVSEQTMFEFFRREPVAHAAFWEAQEMGKISLRRAQLRTAERGNPTMQIWLGKQWLDQTDPDRRDWRPVVLAEQAEPQRPARVIAVFPEGAPDEPEDGK